MPLGDVLVIKPELRRVANEISDILLKEFPRDEKLTIAIGGESGSGKSEIAHVIAMNMFKYPYNLKSFILHFDDFFNLPRTERNVHRRKTNFNHVGLKEIELDDLKHIMINFKKDAGLTLVPIYDIVSNTKHQLIVNFNEIPILIIDGLYANHLKADYNIFIDRTYRDTKKFQAERGKEVMDEFRQRVLEAEHNAIKALRKNANYIITIDYTLEKVNGRS